MGSIMAAITATFGTVEYREGGVIAIPLNFAADVIVPSKSICRITHVSGSDLAGVNYRIIGKTRAFEVVVEVPPDRKGSFAVAMTGTVLNPSTREWNTVTVTASTVTYDTRVPRIVDYDIPADYTVGEKFDVKIAYNAPVTGLSDNNVHQVFILEGAANIMGTPTPYKWIGAEPSDLRAFLETAAPDVLPSPDWQQLQSPPAGVPTTAENDFDENGFWHGAANKGQYFLVRWTVQEGTTGIFSMTPRVGMLRGPISS